MDNELHWTHKPWRRRKRPSGEVVTDGGGRKYVKQRDGKLEYRRYPDGSVTIIDTSKRAGSNRTVGHTGPSADKAFEL